MSFRTIDFPLCADTIRGEKVRPIVEQAARFLIDQVGIQRLEALILTGSLARGEGSVLLRSAGIRLLGDVEFLVILRSPFEWNQVRRQMMELSRRASRKLGEGGRLASIEYGPADLAYLRRKMRPCIFAYDLLRHGKVVWGRRDILGEVRPFGVEAIPQGDAARLIMNRIVELLTFEVETPANGFDREAHAYQLAKTTLDLAGSALAFAGRYISPYAERERGFVAMLESVPGLSEMLPNVGDFQEKLRWATECKLACTEELLFKGDWPASIAAVAGWAKALWLWQMGQLLSVPGASFSQILNRYVTYESLFGRLKGWAKLLVHPLRPQGAISPFRTARFLLRTSPQTLTYAAALLAYWARSGEDGVDWQARVNSLLPTRVSADGGAVAISEIVDLWRWLIRNN